MIHYYINPKTRALIMLDPEAGEIFVVERIEKVRVMTGADIRLGDFEGPNRGGTVDDHEDYHNGHFDPKRGKAVIGGWAPEPQKRKPLKPKLPPGSIPLPQNAPKRPPTNIAQKMDIVRLTGEGKKPKEIADLTGVTIGNVYLIQSRWRRGLEPGLPSPPDAVATV